jgi:hypothetical protein
MTKVTILEKLYGSVKPTTLEKHYSSLISGLKVQLHFSGTTNRKWIKLDIYGEDEKAALSLLNREVGLTPTSGKDIEKFAVIRGKIIFSNKKCNDLFVDLGIETPNVLDAVISASQLRAQLADGQECSVQSLVKLFCLYDNIPIEVKIIKKIDSTKDTVEAILSERQLALFHGWIRSRFDRLIILGSFLTDVKGAVKMSKHSRDIIKIGSLGVLEQVVLCKLGTDAVGLIPKLGRYLKSAVLIPFSPKRILDTIGSQPFDWVE